MSTERIAPCLASAYLIAVLMRELPDAALRRVHADLAHHDIRDLADAAAELVWQELRERAEQRRRAA